MMGREKKPPPYGTRLVRIAPTERIAHSGGLMVAVNDSTPNTR